MLRKPLSRNYCPFESISSFTLFFFLCLFNNHLLNAIIKANFRNIILKPRHFCWHHRKLPPSIRSLTAMGGELKSYPEEILCWLSCTPRNKSMLHCLVNAKENLQHLVTQPCKEGFASFLRRHQVCDALK